MYKSPLHGPRNYVDRMWERSANYNARKLYGSLESLTKKSGTCSPWNFNKKILYLHVSHTARSLPSKSSTPTTFLNVLTYLGISQPYFISFSSPPPQKTHTICNNRPHIWDPWYRGRTKVAFWFGVKARNGACTVISRSFPRSVDIVAWPVQRLFLSMLLCIMLLFPH